MKKCILITLSFCLIIPFCYSQDSLTATAKKTPGALSILFKGKPGKALIYSLILPGAGQVYNKKIWKVPIVYAGIGACIYFIQFNSSEFNRFDAAYRSRVDTDQQDIPDVDEFKDILSLQGINSYRQFYDKNLQLSYIGLGLVYLLTGIEAFVDRHLQEFDVSNNLSIQYQMNPAFASGQISLKFSF